MKRKYKSKKKKKDKVIVISIIVFILCILGLFYYYKMMGKEVPILKPKSSLKIVNENSNERPIAVMIDNNVSNNSHAGLQDSYINYEIIVEGGLTRIMALYKDKDVKLIGPVRSARHYFLDYAFESDAIYAHYGWSNFAEADIKQLDVNNINGLYDDAAYWRDNQLKAPHNVFTSTKRIRDYAKDKKDYVGETKNWKLLNYSTKEVSIQNEDGTNTASNVNIKYSNYQTVSYLYDVDNKYYLRSMNGKEHIDKQTSKQLHYKNIIIEKVSNRSIDNYGRQDLDTVGSGEGYFITNGSVKNIRWEKSNRTSKSEYTYEDGTKVKFNDGNTFIHIVPINSIIDIN